MLMILHIGIQSAILMLAGLLWPDSVAGSLLMACVLSFFNHTLYNSIRRGVVLFAQGEGTVRSAGLKYWFCILPIYAFLILFIGGGFAYVSSH